MTEGTVEFARQLGQLSPSLTALLDEHSEDNFGDILPHLFLADVVRHVVCLLQETTSAKASSARPELLSILGMIEFYFETGRSEIQDLIRVSFLENLPMRAEPGTDVREFLGPKLLSELKKIEW